MCNYVFSPKSLTICNTGGYGNIHLADLFLPSQINLQNLNSLRDTLSSLHKCDIAVGLQASSKLKVVENIVEWIHEASHSPSSGTIELSKYLLEQLLWVHI